MPHSNQTLDELMAEIFSPENIGIASGFLGGGIRRVGRGVRPAKKINLRPSFQDAEGNVFTGEPGTIHAELLQENPALSRLFTNGLLEDGFTLPDGRFVGRVEAKQIAAQNELLSPLGKNIAQPELDSVHLKGFQNEGQVRPIDTMEELQTQSKNLRDMVKAMGTLQDEQAFINNADDIAQVDRAIEIVEQKISKIRGAQQ